MRSTPLGNRYSDISHFVVRCYITQTQDRGIRLLVYDLFMLFIIERNYNTYKHRLTAIIKFTKKYFHIYNTEYLSDIHINNKPFIGFLNTMYCEDIFAR